MGRTSFPKQDDAIARLLSLGHRRSQRPADGELPDVFLSGRADSSGFERLRQQADTGVLLALPLARYDASRMWLNAPFPTQFRDMRYSIHHRGRTYDHEEIGQLTDADCGVFHREAHLDHALVRLANTRLDAALDLAFGPEPRIELERRVDTTRQASAPDEGCNCAAG
jgi:hypothetical protein